MTDFNTLSPDKKVTDPKNLTPGGFQEYPRHMHKYAGPDVINEYIVVTNDDEKADALGKGYSLEPVTEAPPRRGRKIDPTE